MLCLTLYDPEILPDLWRGRGVIHQFGIQGDGRQRIVDFMGDSSRLLTEGGQSLGVPQLLFPLPAFGDVTTGATTTW